MSARRVINEPCSGCDGSGFYKPRFSITALINCTVCNPGMYSKTELRRVQARRRALSKSYCVHVFPGGFTVPANRLVIAGTRIKRLMVEPFAVWGGKLLYEPSWVKAHLASVPCPPGWSKVAS